MQTATQGLIDLIKKSHKVEATPQVIAEWNVNRYSTVEFVKTGQDEYNNNPYPKHFPAKSVVSPLRPGQGIIKARAAFPDAAEPTTERAELGIIGSDYLDSTTQKRYYVASETDPYKYWSSYNQTVGPKVGSESFPFENNFIPEIYVTYTTPTLCNKIVVGFETGEAAPKNFDIFTTVDGTNWRLAASNPPIDSSGRAILYKGPDGWSEKVNRSQTNFKIKGIKLTCQTMTKIRAKLNVIELSPRFELNLTDRLINYSTNYEVSDRSFIAPVGKMSSNKGDVQFDNTDGFFNVDNTDSLIYGLVDKNVKITVDLIFNTHGWGENSTDRVREMTMYVQNWAGQDSGAVNASLVDSSYYMQENKVPSVFFEGLTAGNIMARLCDIMGFANWTYNDNLEKASELFIPYYWSDPEKSLWESLQDLSEATQTAAYFNEFDTLKIVARNRIYAVPVTWNFQAETNNKQLADIQTLDQTIDYEANTVNVNYYKTEFRYRENLYRDLFFEKNLESQVREETRKLSLEDQKLRDPIMDVVWEPEGSEVLRASLLTKNLTSNDNFFNITVSDAEVWPFEGLVNIEGEIIRYRGKEYVYHMKVGGAKTKIIFSAEGQIELDAISNPLSVFANHYTGRFLIKGKASEESLNGRGVLDTVPADHILNTAQLYTGSYFKYGTLAGQFNSQTGIRRSSTNSKLTLKNRDGAAWDEVLLAESETIVNSDIITLGTRINFPSEGIVNTGIGGLYFRGNVNNSAGIYIDFSPSDLIENESRQFRNELSVFIRETNGGHSHINKGAEFLILRDVDYDVSVFLEKSGIFTVSINGRIVLTSSVPSEFNIGNNNNRFGLFVRGDCSVDFEYLYAIKADEDDTPDTSSFYDKVTGSYISGRADRQWPFFGMEKFVYRPQPRGYRLQKKQGSFFDEFGPYVHEIREYDVAFEQFPVGNSYLFLSNTSQAANTEYYSSSYGAKFTVANAYRRNAVLNGEDTLSFGVDNPIEQKMFIFGRVLFQEDPQVVRVRNESARRRRGVSEIDIQSKWIQTSESATQLGEWITEQWGGGQAESAMEIFGNPLIQIGDVVTINYPLKHLSENSKFAVVGKQTSFDEGYTTSLTVRKMIQ